MGEITKSVSEKIIFSLVLTILSTMVLMGYNSYSKIFEAAQADARPMSTLFVKLRNEVVELSLDSVKEVRSAYSDAGAAAATVDRVKRVRERAAHVGRLSQLFAGNAAKTYEAGKALSAKILSWLTVFEDRGNLTAAKIEEFDKEVMAATTAFLEAAKGEFSGVLADEFGKFFDGYYQKVPFYADPKWLLMIAVGVLVITGFVVWKVTAKPSGDS